MHTEDEAKKLWCPMVRAAVSGTVLPAHNYLFDREATGGNCGRCIASGCAMWRWAPTSFYEGRNLTERFGYCGLAGRADHG